MICSLVPNQDVASYFLVVDAPQVRKSKRGSDYATMELVDKSGKIDARLWKIPVGLDTNLLKKVIVKVEGRTSEWEGKLQVTVSKIRPICDKDADVDLADFFERSERDPEEMWQELLGIVQDHCTSWGSIQRLLVRVLTENEASFKRAPAAKHVHHAYIGGLLEHSLSMCRTALLLSKKYGLDQDLLLAGCVLHDLGKVSELSYGMGISYTVHGSLLSHIVIGLEMTGKAIDEIEDFPPNLRIAVLHLIASHHGRLEWGSPKQPLTREAIALHLIDMLDSQMAMCDRLLRDGVDDDGLSAWSKELSGQLWRLPDAET
jgi:3'-5' exoribonuclease